MSQLLVVDYAAQSTLRAASPLSLYVVFESRVDQPGAVFRPFVIGTFDYNSQPITAQRKPGLGFVSSLIHCLFR